MPKVTFVVTAYNVAPYIEQCALSIFEQSLQDIEIIFVDDCTPDDGVEIVTNLLESYPNRKPHVRFVRYEHNRGVSLARKAGVEAAVGEFVSFVDGDDYVEPTMAEELYAKAIESGADVVVCDCFSEGADGSEVMCLGPNGVIGNGDNLRDEMVNRDVWPNVWLRLFRRSLFDNPDLVWPVYSMAEDVVMSSELMLLAKKCDYLPRAFYHYRCNPESITRTNDRESMVRRFNWSCENYKVLFAFLEEHGMSEKYALGILRDKMGARGQIVHLLGEAKYRKLWKSTFPEMNRVIFWGNKYHRSSLRNKVWYILVVLGLYSRLSSMIHSDALRRIVKSKPRF